MDFQLGELFGEVSGGFSCRALGDAKAGHEVFQDLAVGDDFGAEVGDECAGVGVGAAFLEVGEELDQGDGAGEVVVQIVGERVHMVGASEQKREWSSAWKVALGSCYVHAALLSCGS